MKKILTLMVSTLLLTSCFGGTDNSEEKVNEDATNSEENNITVDENNETKLNNDEENVKVTDDNGNTETNEEINNDSSNDDEALETEVNDLLDEFIDSLDSYDK